MTLNTSVAIGSPTNVPELYAFCRTLLGTPEGIKPHTGQDGVEGGSRIYYGADGPMTHTHDEWCDDETHEWAARNPTQNGWAAVEVTFDTTYGYRGDNGESCSDLHARLVTALGRWLDAKGLEWKWQNEYTGEWFDSYNQLDKFGNAHRKTGADDWFRNMVMPAIQCCGCEES